LLIIFRKRLPLRSGAAQTTATKPKIRGTLVANHARRELQKACEESNPQAAARALLDWAAGEWPDQPPHNLGALAHCVDKGADEIHELDRALYAAENSPWDGQALWDRFRHGLHDGKGTNRSSSVDSLSPLYPRWG
jgi:hypothetical protein